MSTQTNHPSVGRCNEYRPKGGDALRLARVWWQVKLCDPCITRVVSEHFRDEVVPIKTSQIRIYITTLLIDYPSDYKWRTRFCIIAVRLLSEKTTLKVDRSWASWARSPRWRSTGSSAWRTLGKTLRNFRHAWTAAWITVAADLAVKIPSIITAWRIARHCSTWIAPADCPTIEQLQPVCGLRKVAIESSVKRMKVKKSKVYVDLYSMSTQMSLTHSNMDQSVLPANNTISAFTPSCRASLPFGRYSLCLPTEV